jgi:pantoate--beta-alanine ligase
MIIFDQIAPLRDFLYPKRNQEQIIGLVPTMGALHDGHLKLIKESKKKDQLTVCSIFVNPIQFNYTSDLENYPKTLQKDINLLIEEGCDVLFTPRNQEIYPNGKPESYLDFGYQNKVLEGVFRPGHFNGVGIIVSKLFNIVQPNNVYFGLKDFQQCIVVRQLIDDFSFQVKLHLVETVREQDGLAMSSRNQRLTKNERIIAPMLYQALNLIKSEIETSKDIIKIKDICLHFLKKEPSIRLEYLDVFDLASGKIANQITSNNTYVFCISAHLGSVRLIDNIVINV